LRIRFWFLLTGLILEICMRAAAESQKDTVLRYRKRIFAVPTLGTGPETGFYGGAVALLDFLPARDSNARHSLVKTELAYTAKKQFIVNLDWVITDNDRKQILIGDNAWMRFPELFWGVGGKTPKSNEVLYDAHRLEINNLYFRRVRPGAYLGVSQQYQSVYRTRFTDFKETNVAVYNQIQTGMSSGIGASFLYDTRSNLLNPRAGEAMIFVQSLVFRHFLGSDFTFANLDADARYYQKTGKKSLLAFQAVAQLRSKEAPYRMLSLLGGPMMLRGFYQGRFRDNNLFAAQTEWRFDFSKWIGLTVFGAAGDVVSFQNPARNGSIKTAGGTGIRIKVDQRENTNMRFDFALTNQRDFGFYVSFGEAF
jgi:hypothetical protein